MTPNMNNPQTLTSDKLSFWTKLVYGMGDWGNTTTSTIFGFFYAFFLNNVAGLEPLYTAPVLLIGMVWDAVNDPIIGIIVDRVHSRWGRRRPFFLFGALPLTITFIALWWVPPFPSQIGKMLYFLATYLLYDTAYTFVTVPYVALTPELSEDYDERTRLTGFRMVVSMAGGLIAAVALPLGVSLFPNLRQGYMVVVTIFGISACVPYFVMFFKVKERFTDEPPSKLNIFSGFVYTWKNKAFRYIVGIYASAWITITLAGSLFQYYVTYYLRSPDQVDIVLGALMVAALIFIPVLVFLSNKWGKKKAFLVAVSSWIVVMIAIAFLPANGIIIAYVLVGIAGFGVAAAHVIPWSMTPDVIEEDELISGHRREGTFYGFMVFLQKGGAALALGGMQLALHFAKYQVPPDDNNPLSVTQPASALLAIRLLTGLVPAILLCFSLYFAWKYPISKEKHNQTLEALKMRRADSQKTVEP
jgi:glycoside/pentoside/hexuronide:cation symporter, GPH family